MNPQQPNTPLQTTTSPQGAASVAPIAQPTAPQLPAAPAVVGTPPPVATPAFDTAGTIKAIGDYYNIPRQTQAITGAGQAEGAVAQQQFEAQKAQNAIKIQNQKDSLDPSKYNFTKNPDGSVDILNSVGDKVDIGTYSALTGDNPATALQKAGATDPASEKFIQAYNNLQTYIQTKISADNGDEQAKASLGDFYKANPGLQNLELGQLQDSFMQQYGQYFGQPSSPSKYNQLGNTPYVSPTLQSANNPSTQSAYQNPNYAADFAANPFQPQGSGYGTTGAGTSVASELAGLQSQVGQ